MCSEGCDAGQNAPDALGVDLVFQRLLHMGSFPMLPVDNNDHSISPTGYLSQPVTMQRCDPTIYGQPQQWTHSRSDLLRGSFSSSAGSGSVCLTPYNANVTGMQPDKASSRASVWLCCGAGTESSCSSLVNHDFSFSMVNGINRSTAIVTTDPDAPTLCLTVLNATTHTTTAVGFEECSGKPAQRWLFRPGADGAGELRARVPSEEEHCLTSPTTARYYKDYTPMLRQLYGRTWVLSAHAIDVTPSAGYGTAGPVANLFRVPDGFVATVVSLDKTSLDALAKVKNAVTVTMRGVLAGASGAVRVAAMHPGGAWQPLAFRRDGADVVCSARTVRGCVLIKVFC